MIFKGFRVLALAAATMTATVASAETFIGILTGGQAGVYYPLGVALEKVFAGSVPESRPSTQSTKASVENLNLLQAGRGEIAFTLGDSLRDAWNGNAEAGFPRSWTSCGRSPASIRTTSRSSRRKESGITTLADLKGKRLSVGAPKSGTELNARAILNAAGMTYEDLGKVEYLPFAESVELMKNRQLDATLQSAGLGVASLRDLATSVAITVVEVPADIVAKVGSPYHEVTIPAGTYDGQDADVATAAVVNYLVTRADLDDETVYQMTKGIFENLDQLVAAHAAAKAIKLDKSRRPTSRCRCIRAPSATSRKRASSSPGAIRRRATVAAATALPASQPGHSIPNRIRAAMASDTSRDGLRMPSIFPVSAGAQVDACCLRSPSPSPPSSFGPPPIRRCPARSCGRCMSASCCSCSSACLGHAARAPGKQAMWWLMGLVGFVLGFYHWVFYADLILRSGLPEPQDLVVGGRGDRAGLRRRPADDRLGAAGHLRHLPALRALRPPAARPLNHRPYAFDQVVDILDLGTEGIYGTPIYVSSTYIFLFILFGVVPRAGRHDPALHRHRPGHASAIRAAGRPRSRSCPRR